MAVKVKIDMRGERELMDLLERLPKLVVSAGGPTDRAVRAGANVVAKRARQIAPSSKATGSRQKQSRSSRNKWPETLREQIKVKVVKYPNSSWAVVGPKSPQGNMSHFVNGKKRRHVLWGKRTAVAMYRYARNWMLQASDETKSQQMDAMRKSLTKDIDAQMKGGS